VTNEHEYVTKMAQIVTMGGLWGDFAIMFWIICFLQRPIYVWNKISKHIMFQHGVDFNSFPYI
jgi:hypothetical protein